MYRNHLHVSALMLHIRSPHRVCHLYSCVSRVSGGFGLRLVFTLQLRNRSTAAARRAPRPRGLPPYSPRLRTAYALSIRSAFALKRLKGPLVVYRPMGRRPCNRTARIGTPVAVAEESTALGLAESSVIKHRDRRASPRLRSARVVAIRELAMADAQEPPRLEGK